jgi:hypothetical protein
MINFVKGYLNVTMILASIWVFISSQRHSIYGDMMSLNSDMKREKQLENSIYELVLKGVVIDVGTRSIVRTARNYKGRSRFAINLPLIRNDLWHILWSRKVPVQVFLKIPEEIISERNEKRKI